MGRRKIEGELQVDEPEILPAAASQRGAEPIEHLGGARLRSVDHRRELPAGLDLAHRLDDQRMTRQRLFESREDFQSFRIASLSREIAAVALHHAQRGRIELVRALEALAGLFLLAGEVEDQSGMQILEAGGPV